MGSEENLKHGGDRPLPKVSVTVITYNHGSWLAECLESIVTQETTFPFEVIVGDDASTDGVTQEILRGYGIRYPNIIVPVFRKTNISGIQNYLDVVRRTRGEYIAHIDGDDMMLPGKLQKQSNFLDQNIDCSLVAHNVKTITGNGELISNHFVDFEVPRKADINYLCLRGCYFAGTSKMYRRSSMISEFRDRRTIDLFFHFEQASNGKIGYLDETLGVYRKSSLSATDPMSAIAATTEQAMYDAFRRAEELGVDSSIVKRAELSVAYARAVSSLFRGNYDAFKNTISISKDHEKYAGFKHRILNLLKDKPFAIRFLMKLKRMVAPGFMRVA
ncbi:MAG: glycosyltransferase [Burkholderiales bacterium]|nr:glycosyltransferase [Burkholderiales bacterium]